MFYDQVFLHNKVIVINTKHRHYPRVKGDQAVVESIKQDVIQAIQKDFPEHSDKLARDIMTLSNEIRKYCQRPAPSCLSHH